MGILSWIIVGFIAGWLAERFFRGPRFGLVGSTIIGIAGGLIGGFLANNFLHIKNSLTGINLTSIVTAFAGSMILLMLIRVANPRRI